MKLKLFFFYSFYRSVMWTFPHIYSFLSWLFFILQPWKFTSKVHCEKFFIPGSASMFFLKCDTYRYEFRQTGFNSDNRRLRGPYKPRTASCNNLNFPLTLLLLGTLTHAYSVCCRQTTKFMRCGSVQPTDGVQNSCQFYAKQNVCGYFISHYRINKII